jgi:uroporphyrinogen decarboxylase
VFEGQAVKPPPIWLMRQAGRYLPEYRALRAKAGSFWSMCMDPAFGAEITLQPIRRFDFDAAVVFSDIFVLTAALGVSVEYEEGFGPRVGRVVSEKELVHDDALWARIVTPVYETLARVRGELPVGTGLIGFAGAPWTLATYLAQGHGSEDQRAAKLWGYRDPAGFDALLDRLADAVARHLVGQLRAGADVVQIFESWASGLTADCFARWVIAPNKKIVAKVRTEYPKARIIGFPRATTLAGYERYLEETGVDAISVDTSTPIAWAARELGHRAVIQGNLDPIVLMAGGVALRDAVDRILDATKDTRFIFNLGHGILKETPVAHVEELVARVRRPR